MIKWTQFCDRIAVVPDLRHGIMPLEAYHFLQACEKQRVERIIESGLCHGISTEMFALGSELDIVSIENKESRFVNGVDYDRTTERLSKYSQIEIVWGDAFDILPELLIKYQDQKVGVLIDGPKALHAFLLLFKCRGVFDNVKVLALHDVHDYMYREYQSVVHAMGFDGYSIEEGFCLAISMK